MLPASPDVSPNQASRPAEVELGLQLEELLADLASRFINLADTTDLGEEIERAQRRLCDLLGFDRSTIWHLSEADGTMRLLRIVQPADVLTPPRRMSAAEHFPFLTARMHAGQAVLVERLADLPSEGERDRESLRQYGAKSTVVIPMRRHGRVFAALTFATTRAERALTPSLVRRLELVAQIFASALAQGEANDALREIRGRLIDAQEKERARLAQELHDGMSQQLAVLAVELQLLAQRPPATTTNLRACLDELSEKTRALASDVHRLSHALHPAKLERLGLVAALGGFCRELDAAESLRVEFFASSVPEGVPADRALSLYRVTQEALWNAVKHSGARHATVTISGRREELLLEITDDGRGFDHANANASTSLGLLGMRERVGMMGGRIRWEARPGGGTVVRVHMPLPREGPA